ncbi:hypothetical protein EYC80_002717 [Monilinia laxa]|uniref:Uncharacterized protein n=1 Tax=Monilinia laxa TaxID=61186 RepID=A0A5N6K4P5_MONLA|nr:hypothetical protein EYC80_002717 [Monilinia laxa]
MSKRRSVREVRTAGRRETQAVRKEKVPATTPSRQPQVVIPRPPAPGARVTTYENEWQLVDRSPKRARPEEGPSNSPIHTPGRNPPRRANKGVNYNLAAIAEKAFSPPDSEMSEGNESNADEAATTSA